VGRDPLRLRHAEARGRRRCGGDHRLEIIAFLRDTIAHYKVPRHVVFGPLPKTSTGKIQKFVLRDQARSANTS
jgi:acyl-coenzyme A synthetase/AMP-(fatty) acid ligase